MVVDLKRLLAVTDYDFQEIQEVFKQHIRQGVQKIKDMLGRGESPRKIMAACSDPYAAPASYLHHAGRLQMRDLEQSMRMLKRVPKVNSGDGDIKIAAAVALKRLGFDEEQQFLDAASNGDVDTIRALLSKVDVNWQVQKCVDRANYCDMNGGETALHLAAKGGHTEVVRLLLEEKGIKTDIRDRGGQTPLFLAANKDIMIKLLDHAVATGVQLGGRWGFLHSTNYKSRNVLHVNCIAGNIPIVEELLQRGLDPKETGHDGVTCLHLACGAGHLELVHMLLKAKAHVDKKARTNKTPLYFAVAGGHADVVKALLERKGLDVGVCPKESGAYSARTLDPALCVASKRRDIKMVKMLLDYPGLDAASVEAALSAAVELRHPDVVELLFDSGKVGSPALETALVVATKESNKDMASLLLTHTLADTRCIGPALVTASEKGNVEMVSFLLQQTRMDPVFCVPRALDVACCNNDPKVAKLLLDTIEVKIWEGSGRALYHALRNDHRELFGLLLENGADVGYKSGDGWTVLHTAIDQGNIGVIRLLLDHGSDPNIRDNFGWSALHWASEKGDAGIVTLLLEFGANGDLKTGKGDTPLDVARSRKQLDVVRLLVLRLSREINP
ncbi:ANK [Seminavis robusta]|uniref:ANK n=1 Tax=Seminavis robusta TaxID=568900 RepID=A0A9N8F111_9STRA|nr:ANK [Seminavis robusta]|eukprot:Sro2546_g330840.1 ANK (616) ;mRNA; r:10463-12310